MSELRLTKTITSINQYVNIPEEGAQARTQASEKALLFVNVLLNEKGEQKTLTVEVTEINTALLQIINNKKTQQLLLKGLELACPGYFLNHSPTDSEWREMQTFLSLKEGAEINIIDLLIELLGKVGERMREKDMQILPLLCVLHTVIVKLKNAAAEQTFKSAQIESKQEVIKNIRKSVTTGAMAYAIKKGKDFNREATVRLSELVIATHEKFHILTGAPIREMTHLLESSSGQVIKSASNVMSILSALNPKDKETMELFSRMAKLLIDIYYEKVTSTIENNASSYKIKR